MKYVLALLLLLFYVPSVAQTIPKNALIYAPLLKQELGLSWPTHPLPSSIAGQIEQESCISLTSTRCWDPRAELKTSRENGIGLGQVTISYNADGSVRFNNFEEFKKLDSRLKSWKFEDRYDPKRQIIMLVATDKNNYNKIKFPVASDLDRLSFSFSAYNGGLGGVLQDVKLCGSTQGCDSKKWFDNVASVSFKSKIKIQGYGSSFFDINRQYVDNIMNKRRAKYVPLLETK